ncbi:MAG TPA: DUF2182 domain-containing protein [Methylomirabilota bacterium]|nr:DUF2182 domain-containing protein [Methylomirabilota bacterium]
MLNQAIEWVARHERVVVAAGLGLIIVLAWAFLFTGAGMNMPDMPDMRHAGFEGMAGFVIVFVMGAVMMVAMMLPSAAPTILLFAALMRSRATSSTFPATGIFAGAYVIVWAAFSAVATIAHWALLQAGLVSSEMRSTSGVLAGLLLVAAGAYQGDADEGRVPWTLPVADPILDPLLEAWTGGGAPGGAVARRVLRRLLLGSHGASVLVIAGVR